MVGVEEEVVAEIGDEGDLTAAVRPIAAIETVDIAGLAAIAGLAHVLTVVVLVSSGDNMKIKRKHGRTQAEAKQRLIGLASTMGMTLEWVDAYSAVGSLKYNGIVVSGAAQVTDTEVVLDVELPRLARMFQSRIQKQVEGQMDEALS